MLEHVDCEERQEQRRKDAYDPAKYEEAIAIMEVSANSARQVWPQYGSRAYPKVEK